MTPLDPLKLGLGLFSGSARAAGRPGRARRGAPESPTPASSAVEHEAGVAVPQLPAHILPLAKVLGEATAELERDATGPALDKYRRAVRRFMEVATHDALQIRTETTLGLSQRLFATVTRVDIMLADLADSVLGSQRDSPRVRELAGQIKGALIDLYR